MTMDATDVFLNEHQDELLDVVGQMIAINSQIPPYGDEREMCAFLQSKAVEFGLGAGTVLASDPDRPNLLLTLPGSGEGPSLALNGHIDTKPIGAARDKWRTDPLEATHRDGNIYGLGASDMKAAVAAMLFAARALRATGVSLGGDLVLALVADEEAGSAFGARFVAPKLSGLVDACLIGEPSGWSRDWQGIHLVSRGLSCFRIHVHGTQMHSSLSDRMPSVNAVERLAELILRMRKEVELPWTAHPLAAAGPTLNIGVTVEGGVFYGVVPGSASFGCDLRTLPGMDFADVRQSLENWLERVNEADPSINATVEFDPNLAWIASAEIDARHDLVTAIQSAAASVLGTAPELSIFPGTTDAPWFEAAGIPTLASFGPGILTHCHGPNEFVSADSITAAARIYARAAAQYCRVRA